MSKTYNEFVDLVRDWTNRDSEVLSDSIVADCMDYAVGKAYRVLRTQDLETTLTLTYAELESVTTSSNGRTVTSIPIPTDLLEYIQIRGVDENTGGTSRVFNERTDVRTFHDPYAEKYSQLAFWTRKGSSIELSPGVSEDESIEIHYYAKLPQLNERYIVTADAVNADSSLFTEIADAGDAPIDAKTGAAVETVTLKKSVITLDADSSVVSTTYYASSVDDGDIPAAGLGQTRTITSVIFYGNLKANWFRDENERILLYGAVAQAFTYLNEPDSAVAYEQRFATEVAEVMSEERWRNASGGNIQININGGGLI